MKPIRVVLADDQSLVRAGITALLAGSEQDGPGPDAGWEPATGEAPIVVVGEAPDGVTAVRLVRRLRPDVVLMDIRMPGGGGIEATRVIREDPECGAAAVLMLTTFDTDAEVFGAMRAGADGYLLKDTAPGPLRAAVRAAARGEPVLSPGVARRVMGRAAETPERGPDPRLARLTGRELDVLRALADGDDNATVARALSLSPETVRTYVSRILAKLDAASRAQLVAIAHRSGLAAERPSP